MNDTPSKKLSVKPEEAATCLVVDLLLQGLVEGQVLSHEVPFADHKRRADLVICNSHLIGIEIKSAEDNVSQALRQLEDYMRCFDFSVLATTSAQIKAVYDKLPRSIGLIEISSEKAQWRRKPLALKRKDKGLVTSWLSKDAAINLAKCKNLKIDSPSKLSVYDIRNFLSKKLNTNQLMQAVRYQLTEKALPNFVRFKRDYQNFCTPEDLMNLRRKDVGQQLRG